MNLQLSNRLSKLPALRNPLAIPPRTHERVLIVDPSTAPVLKQNANGQVVEVDQPSTAYWFASVPISELVKHTPSATCRFRQTPTNARWTAWLGIPAAMFLVTIAFLVLFVIEDIGAQLVGAAMMGIMAAGFFGAPAGWYVVKRWLQTRVLWAFARLPQEVVKGADGTEYVRYELAPIVPPPMMSEYSGDTKALMKDTNDMLWNYEMLQLGVEGKSREQYLELMGAARNREIALKHGNQPKLDQAQPRSPGDRPPPGAQN